MSEGIHTRQTPLTELVAAAHELKTPLTIIAHLAAAMDDETLGLTTVERQVALERIRLSAERTLRLVQGLTTAYRLGDQLSFRFALEPLHITQVCEEVAHEILPFARQYDQTLRIHSTTRSSQLIVGNSELLRSVLFNLLDNAIKHNPPDTEVNMRLSKRHEKVRVCVRDNGPGLKKNDFRLLRQHLGWQLQPLAGRASSSGLGLYIACQMAEAMHGCIGVGAAKVGADFHVDLLQSKQLSFL